MADDAAQQPGDMTVAQYLASNRIDVAALNRDEAARLGVVLTAPAGWEALPVDRFPGATEVLVEEGLTQNGFTPNAVLLVGKLSAAVDSAKLLDCSFTDARAMPGWTDGGHSSADVGGSPSRFIRGTFSTEGLELAVTTRYALVRELFLVQLTITILAEHQDRLSFDMDAMNDGVIDIRS